jgi:hypothetical protein
MLGWTRRRAGMQVSDGEILEIDRIENEEGYSRLTLN